MNLPDDQYDNLLFTRSDNKSPERYSQQDEAPQSFNRTMPLINIGCGEDHTIRELTAIVAEVLNYRGDPDWDDSKPDGTPQKLLDVSRLNRLGWKHKVSLKEGINTTYSWYIDQIRP
jgi:nucleoside-diphosphate-sugar epimerase